MLSINSLVTGYKRKQVLNGVDMEIARGEIVGLIGHNGAGKSTLLRAIFGLIKAWEGRIEYNGKQVVFGRQRDLLQEGLAYIPQGGKVFRELSVRENLELSISLLSDKDKKEERLTRVLDIFPVLRKKAKERAALLCGGEKQFLSLANVFILCPRLLLLDEPLLSLDYESRHEVMRRIENLNSEYGVTVLIVDQKVNDILSICNRAYCLRMGKVTFSGAASVLANDFDTLSRVFF